MNNFKYSIVAILLLISFSVVGQKPQRDVIYMNNGTFLYGNIVETIPGKSVRIYLNKKDTLEVPLSDIKIIKKEDIPDDIKSKYENGVKTSGYTFIGELTYGFGKVEPNYNVNLPSEDERMVMLTIFNGVTISPYIQFGLGTALEFWRYRGFIPIYLDFRSNLLKTRTTPFLFVNGGYSIGWITSEHLFGYGGLMAVFGGGVKIGLAQKKILAISCGFMYQQTNIVAIFQNVESREFLNSHFGILKAGFVF
jgi:hypothetical protein